MADVLTVSFDHEQTRGKTPQLGYVTVGGVDGEKITDRPISGYSKYWRSQTSNEDDTWIDPITGTLMLTPLPLLAAWATTSAGDFARLGLAAFTFATSANWVIHNVNGSASSYIHGLDSTVSEAFETVATYAANQPIYFSALVEDASNEERAFIEVGWDLTNANTTIGGGYDAAKTTWFRFFTSGTVEVYFDGDLSAVEQISPVGSNTKGGLWSQWAKVVIIPMRTGILVYSDSGGGFFWERPDVEPDQTAPITITPASKKLWWWSYGSATVEFAPLKFRSSGNRSSLRATWPVAPVTGATTLHRVFGDNVTGNVTATFVAYTDNTTALEAAGAWTGTTEKDARIKFTLTAASGRTPFVYAVHSSIAGENTVTDSSEEKDVTPYITRFSFDVPESKGEMSFSFDLTNAGDLADDLGAIPYMDKQTMRPTKVAIAAVQVFDGMIAERPRVTRGLNANRDRYQFKCEGLYRLLKRYRFADFYPLDQTTVTDALIFCANEAGITTAQLDIEDFGLVIGEYTRPSRGDFHAIVKPGDTAAMWWEKIFNEYLPDCHWCEKPTATGVKLVAFSPDNRPALTTPYRIFDTQPGARTYLEAEYSYTEAELNLFSTSRVFRSLDEYGFEPECNVVWVQGVDRRTRRPIVYYSRVAADQDPETAPSARSQDWSGDINIYGYANTALATDAQVQDAAERLATRLTYGRDLREIEVDMMIDPDTGIPLWTGDTIEIEEYRLDQETPVVSDWTIVRFGGECVKEVDDNGNELAMVFRPCRYVLELVKEGTSGGLGHSLPGATLWDMAAFHDLRRWNSFAGRPENLAPRASTVSI